MAFPDRKRLTGGGDRLGDSDGECSPGGESEGSSSLGGNGII